MFSTPYPETSWRIPWLHSLFGNAPAVATGVAAALKVKGRTDVRVVGQAGDGGTVDIGFGCLSGMFERNDDVLFICYDNEAYMNTGVQRSGATPPAARTATTEAVGPEPGNTFGQGKDLPRLAMAHDIPYVATATVADLHDLEAKVERAMELRGARYLHVLVPCPLGWGTAPSDTIRLARLATESGLFPVFEAEHGEVTGVVPIRRRVPVEDYLRLQRRYAHLFGDARRAWTSIARIQAIADRNIAALRARRRPGPTTRGPLMEPRSPSPSTSARAAPTTPARGGSSGRSMSTGSRRATTPARPARTSRVGSTRPSPATTSRRGGDSSRTTRSPR